MGHWLVHSSFPFTFASLDSAQRVGLARPLGICAPILAWDFLSNRLHCKAFFSRNKVAKQGLLTWSPLSIPLLLLSKQIMQIPGPAGDSTEALSGRVPGLSHRSPQPVHSPSTFPAVQVGACCGQPRLRPALPASSLTPLAAAFLCTPTKAVGLSDSPAGSGQSSEGRLR